MKLKKILSLVTLAPVALALLSVSLLVTPANAQPGTGKIHGKIVDPTGVPKTEGTASLSKDRGATLLYSFPIGPDGTFSGSGIKEGSYSLIFRLPETPKGKIVDEIEDVKIVADTDIAQDVDMSRKAYISKMTPEQRKQLEDFKKKNADIMKGNAVVKTLNADLAEARADNHDKKFDAAEALMAKDTSIDPLPPQSETLFYELGMAQIGLKKWDDAVTALKKAVDLTAAEKKPNTELIGGAQSGLGEAYAHLNKPDDAAAQYDLAAKANPAKAGVYYSNEAAIFSNAGNNEASLAAAEKAIAADPKVALPYYLKGQALLSIAAAAGKVVPDPKTNLLTLPPGCLEAYNKYLELQPTGGYSDSVKGILAQSQTKVETKVSNKKK